MLHFMLKVLIPKTEVNLNEMRVRTHLARETYIDKMVKYGILPVFATANMTNRMYEELEAMTSGLLLMGGLDITPQMYGHEPHEQLKATNKNQDEFERRMFQHAYEAGKPILGICRGCQMINVSMGGTLHQHIPDLTDLHHDKSDGGGNYDTVGEVLHPVEILSGTKLHTLMDGLDHVVVTSGHHQAVDRVGEGLRVTALSPDGIIEGIESTDPSCFCFGVQSHPEVQAESFFEPLFAEFAQNVTRYAHDSEPYVSSV